jgi:hypothetical protein
MSRDVTAALEASLRFLLARQDSDGAWRDFRLPSVGRAESWTTAYIALRVEQAAQVAHQPVKAATTAAAAFLRRNCAPRGGWAYNVTCPADADSTAHALLFLRAAPLKHVAALARFQSPGGGLRTYLWPAPGHGWGNAHPEVTATALRALLPWLGPEHGIVRAGMAWLHAAAELEAGAYWWEAPDYLALEMSRLRSTLPEPPTAPGIRTAPAAVFGAALALERAVLLTEPPCELAERAAALLERQGADGSWPRGAILRLPDPAGGGMKLFEDEQRLFTTATVVSALAAWSRAAEDHGSRQPP